MNTALVCIALLALLLVGLGFAVSMLRGRTNTLSGYSDDPSDPLHKLARAHANTAEYAPMLSVLFFLVARQEPAAWELWCIGLATASRYLIAVGMIMSSTLDEPHPLRFVGALGTYLTGFALTFALLLGL